MPALLAKDVCVVAEDAYAHLVWDLSKGHLQRVCGIFRSEGRLKRQSKVKKKKKKNVLLTDAYALRVYGLPLAKAVRRAGSQHAPLAFPAFFF